MATVIEARVGAQRPDAFARSARHVSLAATAAITAIGTAVALAFPINMDAGYMLRCAEQMLAGKRLYTDIVMSHPPLTFWFAELVVAVSRAAHVTPMTGIKLATALLAVLSLALCWRVGTERTRAALPVLAFACFVLPGYRFAQEEIWLVALIAPYVLSTSRPLPTRLAIVTGVLAGLGFSIKPYFLLAYLVAELVRQEPLRPQNLAVMATGLLYAASILVLEPAFVPFAFWTARVYADAFAQPWPALVLNWRAIVALEGALVGLVYARRHRDDRIPLALTLVALALLAAALVQGKGFDYHYLPALVFGLLALGYALASAGRAVQAIALGAAIAGAAITAAHWRTPDTNRFYMAQTLPIVTRFGGPIAVLGVAMRPIWPLANYAGVEVASRFPSLWTMPYVLEQGTEADRAALRRQVIEDFQTGRPHVVFVQYDHDYLGFFTAEPRFREIWSAYRPFREVGPYRLFVRP